MVEINNADVSDKKCAGLIERVEAYVDEELDGAELERFEVHLSGCEVCQRAVDQARSVAVALRRLPSLVCPPDVVSATRERLKDGGSSRVLRFDGRPGSEVVPRSAPVSPSRLVAWARAAAILLAIGAGSFGVLTLLERPQSKEVVHYSQADLLQAEQDLRVALAYFGGLTEKAGLVLRDDVIAERVLAPSLRSFSKISSQSQPSSVQ